MTNCKNCGMPLVGSVCEYCDTRYDLLDISIKPLIAYKPTPISSLDIERGIITVPNISKDSGTVTFTDDGLFITGNAGTWRWNKEGMFYEQR